MIKKLLFICCSIILLSGCKTTRQTVQSQNVEEQSSTYTKSPIDIITSDYYDWQQIQLNGKIKIDGLPIKPSVKIYMQKDSQVIISLRVPLLGEAARIEIDENEILLANKLKNVYCKESVRNIYSDTHTLIGAFQDILLCRAFVLEEGTLSTKNSDSVKIKTENIDTWLIIPQKTDFNLQYAFAADSRTGRLTATYAQTIDNSVSASAAYNYESSTTEIQTDLTFGDNAIKATLTYESPDLNPSKLAQLNLNNKWRKVSFKDFMQSF